MGQDWQDEPRSPMDSGNHGKDNDRGCCPMVAALRSARHGRFRLAARYARWSLRLVVGQR